MEHIYALPMSKWIVIFEYIGPKNVLMMLVNTSHIGRILMLVKNSVVVGKITLTDESSPMFLQLWSKQSLHLKQKKCVFENSCECSIFHMWHLKLR